MGGQPGVFEKSCEVNRHDATRQRVHQNSEEIPLPLKDAA